MKYKSLTITLTILLFILGLTEFMLLFMKFQLPDILIIISRILLFTISMLVSIQIPKLRKLVYPIIILFYFVGMPIIESFLYSKSLYIGFSILSFVIVIIFIYKDLILTNKEKKLRFNRKINQKGKRLLSDLIVVVFVSIIIYKSHNLQRQ